MTGLHDTARAGLPGPAPAPSRWQTRGQLLQDRADAVRDLDRQDLSSRAFALSGLALAAVALGCLLVGSGLADEGSVGERGVVVALGLLLVAPGVLHLVRALPRRRAVGAALFTWEDLEDTPAARALPAGDIAPGLREPFDARRDDDFEAVAGRALSARYAAAFQGRVLLRALLLSVPLVVGPLLLLFAFTGRDEPGMALGSLLAGIPVTAAALLGAAKVVDRAYRRTVQWRRLGDEIALWRADRALRDSAVGTAPARRSTAGQAVVGALGAALALFLVVRLSEVAPAARLVVLTIVVGAAAVAGAALLRARAADRALVADLGVGAAGARAVVAGRADGDRAVVVVGGPDGPEVVLRTGGTTRTAPLSDVFGATVGPAPYPAGPRVVHVLMRDGAVWSLRTRAHARLVDALASWGVRVV